MKYEDVKRMIETIAPPDLAEPWDNSGTQIKIKEYVEKALICLEITRDVIREAEEKGCDLIISHHPLLFDEMSSIDTGAYDTALARQAELSFQLIKAGINVYSAHTSFDNAPKGNNYYVAKLLGAEEIKGPGEGLEGSIGELAEEMDLCQFSCLVKEKFDIPGGLIRKVGGDSRKVKRIAVCTGAGGVFMDSAVALGADVLVTGDVKFDQAHKAAHHGLALIDAGHFGTEKPFERNFAEQLRAVCSGLEVFESENCTDPWSAV